MVYCTKTTWLAVPLCCLFTTKEAGEPFVTCPISPLLISLPNKKETDEEKISAIQLPPKKVLSSVFLGTWGLPRYLFTESRIKVFLWFKTMWFSLFLFWLGIRQCHDRHNIHRHKMVCPSPYTQKPIQGSRRKATQTSCLSQRKFYSKITVHLHRLIH